MGNLNMTSADIEQYHETRYKDQLQWYSSSATNNKTWHRRFQVGIAVLSAGVTVTVALGMNDGAAAAWHIVSLTTSALITVLATLQKVFRFHDNWVEYRTTAEDLKKERYYHEFLCGDYANAECPDQLFVERVEALISQQNTQWSAGTTTARLAGGLGDQVKSLRKPSGD